MYILSHGLEHFGSVRGLESIRLESIEDDWGQSLLNGGHLWNPVVISIKPGAEKSSGRDFRVKKASITTDSNLLDFRRSQRSQVKGFDLSDK